jgi:hypothetical protein
MQEVSSTRTAIAERLRTLCDAARMAPANGRMSAGPLRTGLNAREVVVRAAGLWLVTRVALVLFTYFAVTYANGHAHGPVSHDNPVVATSLSQYVVAWRQWDTYWYLTIVAKGYSQLPTAAFFPLYPTLVRALSFVLGPQQDALNAALVVSNVASLAAFIGLGLFATQEAGLDTATLSIRLLAAYPLAFFLASGYSDGLFLALAAFVLFFARRGEWRWAAVCAFLAGLTRLTAVILILPLLWEYVRQHDLWEPSQWRTQLRNPGHLAELLATLAAVPAGIGVFVVYLWHAFGDWKVTFHAERLVWGHQTMLPWTSLWMALRNFFAATPGSVAQAHIAFDLGLVVICGALTLLALRHLPVAFSLYMIGLLALCMMSPIAIAQDVYISAGRYLLAAAPLFLLLGQWSRRPWLDTLLVSAGFLVQGALAVQFLSGYWII